MINPTIETDLVGELIEVYERARNWTSEDRKEPSMLARGRCRAVSANENGDIQLWLEVLAHGYHCGYVCELGDIVRVSSDTGNGDNIIRLIKT